MVRGRSNLGFCSYATAAAAVSEHMASRFFLCVVVGVSLQALLRFQVEFFFFADGFHILRHLSDGTLF